MVPLRPGKARRGRGGEDARPGAIRLGHLYGARNRAMHQYLYPLIAKRRMMFIGRADNEMAMIHASDAVRAIVQAGRVAGAAGQILIAAGTERVTQKDYFDALADG